MAHTKAGGSTALGRDSQAKRLGVKLFAGQFTKPGMIIVRQRGSKYRPGENVRRGSDDTLYSAISGYIKFATKKIKKFDGDLETATYIHVFPTKPAAGIPGAPNIKKGPVKVKGVKSKKLPLK
jgi:large subunit ribosomal protein L27